MIVLSAELFFLCDLLTNETSVPVSFLNCYDGFCHVLGRGRGFILEPHLSSTLMYGIQLSSCLNPTIGPIVLPMPFKYCLTLARLSRAGTTCQFRCSYLTVLG